MKTHENFKYDTINENMYKTIIVFLITFISAENERNCAVKCLVGTIVNLPFCQNDDKSTESICLLKRESFSEP